MRPLDWRRAVWAAGFLLAWLGSMAAGPGSILPGTRAAYAAEDDTKAKAPAAKDQDKNKETDAGAPKDADVALQRALDLERQRNWTAAITAYEDALERWPAKTEFRHRLRLCEIHYKLGRRYQDQSFRSILLRLPEERALDLYDELLERIQTHYVEPVGLEPLLRHGLDNLEVALRDPVFLQAHCPKASVERVRWLRDVLRSQRDQLSARDRDDARAQVLQACERARQGLGLPAPAVVLEFIFGACDALDDYTCYLTPDKLKDLNAMIEGNFVGLGVELKLDDKGLRLVGVIRGGPAFEAGLKVGDRITHVNDQPVQGLSLDEAAGKLQGDADTTVSIVVLRHNGTSKRLYLTRRAVDVESVTQARIVDPANGVGYIQLSGFQKTSTEELERAIGALTRKGMRFLVLDLRGNPGGLLNEAVEIADQFLDEGIIVSTRGRATNQSFVYRDRATAPWRMPMAVLIDHDSASASEILAGALKDHNRATIVGQRSYGKGSVQSIFSLRSGALGEKGAGLKLTTAKFYSPRNRPYSEQGVEPDVEVRIAARPTGAVAADDPDPAAEFGDPQHDPVLARTLQLAKRQLTSAR